MACTIQYACDICGAKRAETNHWFAINPPEARVASVVITAFDTADGSDRHYCGESCLLKAVAAMLPELHK